MQTNSQATREEEEQVFPVIRQLVSVGPGRVDAVATLQSLFAKLEYEHEKAGAALERFASLSDRHAPPEWAYRTFRALYDTLARLERNMRQHVHKENYLLLLRTLALGLSA